MEKSRRSQEMLTGKNEGPLSLICKTKHDELEIHNQTERYDKDSFVKW